MLKKRIHMFGAGLFVVAAMVVGAAELARPVEAVQRVDCCMTNNPATCASGQKCEPGGTEGCPIQNPSYTGHCVTKKTTVNVPIEGDF